MLLFYQAGNSPSAVPRGLTGDLFKDTELVDKKVKEICESVNMTENMMENIGSGSVGVGAGPAAPVPHHSNYNCDISLVSGGDRRQHQHQSSSSVHHSHHLSLHDREKSFSVNHLLELPGQQAHMYHAGLHDSVGSDLQRVNQTLGVDQHHRLNSQQLKLQEGRTYKQFYKTTSEMSE